MQAATDPEPDTRPRETRSAPSWGAYAALVTAILAAYAGGIRNDYVGLDDRAYISENPLLSEAGGLWRIWSTSDAPQYYPLTFSSYWIEYQLWGARPAGYFGVNVLLHTINALLVLALARAFGLGLVAAWVAAALFALHPMQVASVAWLAERKNVLSTLFALLTMLLYLRSTGRVRHTACLVAFACALLSKTAVLTLPLSLLLADRWVFGRAWRAAVVRSAPLFALSAAAAAVTLFVENLSPVSGAPWALRPLIAAGAIWFYITKMVFPVVLLPVYAQWHVTGSSPALWGALLGVAASVAVLWRYRGIIGRPISWGLAHFAVMLLPVLGLIPFGFLDLAPVADHFVYFALLGPLIAIACALEHMLARVRTTSMRGVVLALVGVVVIALGVKSGRQVSVWRDEHTLFNYILRYDPDSALANQKIGFAELQAGRYAEAATHYEKVAAAWPDNDEVRSDLGVCLLHLGRPGDAAAHFRAAIAQNPENALAHFNFAALLASQRDLEQATAEFRAGLRVAPDSVPARLGLASVLNDLHRTDQADREYRVILKAVPSDSDVRVTYARALAEWKRFNDARAVAADAARLARSVGHQRRAAEIEAWMRRLPAAKP